MTTNTLGTGNIPVSFSIQTLITASRKALNELQKYLHANLDEETIDTGIRLGKEELIKLQEALQKAQKGLEKETKERDSIKKQISDGIAELESISKTNPIEGSSEYNRAIRLNKAIELLEQRLPSEEQDVTLALEDEQGLKDEFAAMLEQVQKMIDNKDRLLAERERATRDVKRSERESGIDLTGVNAAFEALRQSTEGLQNQAKANRAVKNALDQTGASVAAIIAEGKTTPKVDPFARFKKA